VSTLVLTNDDAVDFGMFVPAAPCEEPAAPEFPKDKDFVELVGETVLVAVVDEALKNVGLNDIIGDTDDETLLPREIDAIVPCEEAAPPEFPKGKDFVELLGETVLVAVVDDALKNVGLNVIIGDADDETLLPREVDVVVPCEEAAPPEFPKKKDFVELLGQTVLVAVVDDALKNVGLNVIVGDADDETLLPREVDTKAEFGEPAIMFLVSGENVLSVMLLKFLASNLIVKFCNPSMGVLD
jgi:hypothetical protein